MAPIVAEISLPQNLFHPLLHLEDFQQLIKRIFSKKRFYAGLFFFSVSTATVCCFPYARLLSSDPAAFAKHLSVDRSIYDDASVISAKNLWVHAYGYQRNSYLDVFKDRPSFFPMTAKDGKVPAFKVGDDVFVVIYKWKNNSQGLAISNDYEFVSNLQKLDNGFQAIEIDEKKNIYEWSFDAEAN